MQCALADYRAGASQRIALRLCFFQGNFFLEPDENGHLGGVAQDQVSYDRQRIAQAIQFCGQLAGPVPALGD